MKRYKINQKLKEAIRNSKYSMRKISQMLGFEVKNIYCRNFSIREDHFKELRSLLNLSIQLEEVNLDYGRNLGKNAFTKPIQQFDEGEDLAEIIGIMLGDGNMFENQIKIFLDSRDKHYTIHVKDLFKKLTSIELKEEIVKVEKCVKLHCCNKLLAEKLIQFGLKRGDKINNQIGIPQWIKDNPNFEKRCLKGLVDTDGCIIFCKRDKQLSIIFSNHNLKLLNDFKEIAKNLGYNFAKANKWNTRLYRKVEVARFINDIKPFKIKGSSASLD